MRGLGDYTSGGRNQAQWRRLRAVYVFGALVLAFLAYLGWLFVPALLPKSAEERYLDDLGTIQLAIQGYKTGYPAKPLAGGGYGRRVGIIGLGDAGKGLTYSLNANFAEYHRGTSDAIRVADAGSAEIPTLGAFNTNPAGGSRGGTPHWEDVDGNGMRNTGAERLFFHDALPQPAVDHWNTTTVIEFSGADEYVVDSRDWFIDMVRVIEKEFLDDPPASASRDNHPEGTGSYSWYIDEQGAVKSMLYEAPTPDSDGYQGVYP